MQINIDERLQKTLFETKAQIIKLHKPISRIGQVDACVEGGAKDEVDLVPPGAVPVQTGPGDHPLGGAGPAHENRSSR